MPPPPAPFAPEELPWLVTLRWLVRLRWVTIGGLLLVVAFARLAIPESAAPGWPLALVAVAGVSNVALDAWARRSTSASDRLLASILLADVLLLTALLAIAGGPGNPFSVIYLVQVTLAAVVLGARWTWVLVGATVACFGALFLIAPSHTLHVHGSAFPLHLQGMWMAFGVTASLIAYFVTQIAAALRVREGQVRELQRRAAVNDKLASLSTLAAGAAHELGTPLSTIALAAKELERSLAALPAASLTEDAHLIRTEVDRCREILNQLSANAGESAGEMSVALELADLARGLSETLTPSERSSLKVELEAGARATLPPRAVVQALRTLVRNGLDAGPGDVLVRMRRSGDRLEISVEDRGAGMAPEVLARAGEPFFTTKAPGRGLGLGLFLTRAVAERLGGGLSLRSEPGRGTVATLDLPGTAA